MHEVQGFFCKTINHWIIDKFADGKKNISGPKLLGWAGLVSIGSGTAHQVALGRRWRGSRGLARWALALEVNAQLDRASSSRSIWTAGRH